MPLGGTPIRKRVGQRRHSVSLQQGTTVNDAIGGQTTTTWTEFGRDRAAIDATPFIVSETEASILYRVTLKYRSDVATRFAAGGTIRCVGGGKTLKVLQVENPEQRNLELVLHCAEMAG